jgi:hypothetical protein
LSDPKWLQAKLFVEEALTFYAYQILSQTIQDPSISVNLCAEGNFSGQYKHFDKNIMVNVQTRPLSELLFLLESLERKEINAHYIGDILYSAVPSRAGVLNYEIYHAIDYANGAADCSSHTHRNGVNFEVCARKVADAARSRGILTELEKKIHGLLEKNGWTADTLKSLVKEAKVHEANQARFF